MIAFELTVLPFELAWAQQQAASAGGRLLRDDARPDGFILLTSVLPDSLAPFRDAAAGQGGGPKTKAAPCGNALFWALSVPYTHRAIAQAAGAKWDKSVKCFAYHGTALPEALAIYAALPLSLEAAIERAKRDIAPQPWNASGEVMVPRPHQVTAGQAALAAAQAGYPGFLLADEVGLGKTISAWLGAQHIAVLHKAQTALIVAPLAVLAHWRQTLPRMGSAIPDVVLINYDSMEKLFAMPDGVKAKTKKGVARRAVAPEVDIVIFDESHKIKNPAAARFKLAAKIADKAKFCLYLSATAGQNPLELSYLSALIAKSSGASARSLKDFEQWCIDQGLGLSRGRFGALEWSGEQNDCERLRHILYEGTPPAGLRRRPEQIAGWPEISRILLPQELSAEQRLLYLASWENFRTAIRTGRLLPPKGHPSAHKGIAALVEALRFRQKSSELRIGQSVAFALDLLDQGIKPAISCAFKTSAQSIKDALEAKGIVCAYMHGALDARVREAERLRFQQAKADVVLFTMEEGISLHQGEYQADNQPRSLLIHDLRWSAIQMAQIEGRTHRDGQFAQAYWMAGENTVEMSIAKRVAEKTVAMKSLSGDADATIDADIMDVLLASL